MQLVLIVTVLNLLLSPRLRNIYLNLNIPVQCFNPSKLRQTKMLLFLVQFLYSYLFCLPLKLSLDRLP